MQIDLTRYNHYVTISKHYVTMFKHDVIRSNHYVTFQSTHEVKVAVYWYIVEPESHGAQLLSSHI